MVNSSIKEKLSYLKSLSGTHSPSIATILTEIPQVKIKVDACFLSNPYATELFIKYLQNDLIETKKLRSILEFYPPQNNDISKSIVNLLCVDPKTIFVGNGAIEIIQAVLHRFVKNKICVIIPTFSSYYEFVNKETQVVYYQLKKENNFALDKEDYVQFVKKEKPDTIVIINPNNPNGGYITSDDLQYIIHELSFVDNIIIDESFIHFAFENTELSQITVQGLLDKFKNLIIIKSMSKDFGIAGIRAGYGIMSEEKVKTLLSNGYLWNISGLADYFFKIYSEREFNQQYEIVRKKYIMNTVNFLNEINKIEGIKAYPSKANFVLIELCESNSADFVIDLLVNHGVYVRDCSDKIGLEGNFIRVASRTFEENLAIIEAIEDTLKNTVR